MVPSVVGYVFCFVFFADDFPCVLLNIYFGGTYLRLLLVRFFAEADSTEGP